MSDFDSGAESQIGAIDPTTGSDFAADMAPDSAGSVVNPFLKNVNPADRPVLERYLKDWDANVTKRFQAIHDQYRPYKEFGDPDTLRSAMAVYQMLDTDPMQIYRILEAELADELGTQGTGQQQGQLPGGQQEEVSSEWGELPPAAVQKLSQMEQLLTAMAERLIDQDKTTKQQKDDEQLQTTLDGLRKQYGEFDEEYVLSKMFRGMKPDEAVKAYKTFVTQTVSQHGARRAPNVLTGASTIPAGQQPQNGEQRKSMFADMLAQTQRD